MGDNWGLCVLQGLDVYLLGPHDPLSRRVGSRKPGFRRVQVVRAIVSGSV